MKNVLDVEILKDMLPGYGYEFTQGDLLPLSLAADRAVRRLEDYLNRKDFPPHVISEAYRMALGEFLYIKKLSSTMNPSEDGTGNFKFPDRVTQLTEGDSSVSITMGGKNDEELLMKELDEMRKGDPYILDHYRRVHWFC